MPEDSVKKRYIYKLLTNLIGFSISLATAGMVPRALGVNKYGNFNFVNNILTQFMTLLDMRTSTCFYTRLSQNNGDEKLVIFYGRLSFILIGILLLFTTCIAIITPLHDFLLPGQSILMIYCCLLYIVFTWLLEQMVRILDARGLTVILEKHRMINKVGGCIVILILYGTNNLNLTTFFVFQYVTLGLLIFIFVVYLARKGYPIRLFSKLTKQEIKTTARRFYIYTSPLAFYVIIQFFVSIFDRWILQISGGSYEQGLYAFSFTFSNYCFIFVTALIPIFTRELSIAASKREIPVMARLFRQYVPLLYAITAYFCCFIFVQADEIVHIFGGAGYVDAVLSLKILAFYPLVSTYSNLNGSVIYANGKTKIFFKLSLVVAPLGIITAYWLIAKMNLGAAGLSLKNLGLEFVSVCTILWINAKYLELNFLKYLLHMVGSIIPFLILGVIVKHAINLFHFSTEAHVIITFFINGIFYSILVIIFIFFIPQLVGLSKNNLKYYVAKFSFIKNY